MPKPEDSPEPVTAEVPEIDPDNLPSASEAGVGSEQLYPGLEQRPLEDYVKGREIAVLEWQFLPPRPEWNKPDGTPTEYVVIKCQDIETGDVFTTGTGASALTDGLKRASGPFRTVIIVQPGKRYLVFSDPNGG